VVTDDLDEVVQVIVERSHMRAHQLGEEVPGDGLIRGV
jgi:hypothetical protein